MMQIFVYLHKKILVPNCKQVCCVAWSWRSENLACGGDNGVLRVLQLNHSDRSQSGSQQSNKNLFTPQMLESHKSTVINVAWNEATQKLTSEDESGSIVVWTTYKGMWYEELVNSRGKALVVGMGWSRDGSKISIVYDDGSIIIGGSDGEKVWGKDVKNTQFTRAEWSADNRLLLVGTKDFEAYAYETTNGSFVRKVQLPKACHEETAELMAIRWSTLTPIAGDDSNRRLMFAYDDGIVHLLKDQLDEYPLNVRTELELKNAQWSCVGDMFAVIGRSDRKSLAGYKDSKNGQHFLKLYNCDGNLLYQIKILCNSLMDCSWERNDLRLALAVDNRIYLAYINSMHQWAFLGNSILFVLPEHHNATPESGTRLIFWEMVTNQKYERQIRDFCQLTTFQSYCAVVSKIYAPKRIGSQTTTTREEEFLGKNTESLSSSVATDARTMYCLSLLNSTGALIDLHTVDLAVQYCALNSTRLIVTSEDSLYIWHFGESLPARRDFSGRSRNEKLLSELTLEETSLDRSLFSDSASAPVRSLERSSASQDIKLISKNDPISCITASEKSFLLAHNSGIINQYALPNVILMHTIQPSNTIPSDSENFYRPMAGLEIRTMAFNQNCSRFAMLHKSGHLFCYDFEANNEETNREGKWLSIGRAFDIWDIKWSSDHSDYLAIYEKNNVVILDTARSAAVATTPSPRPETSGTEGRRSKEDRANGNVVTPNGYIASFGNFTLKCVNLNSLITDTVNLLVKDCSSYVECFDVGPRKQLKTLLEQESIDSAVKYVKQHFPNQWSLWNVIIEQSLLADQLETTQEALIKCRDYRGIQFLKRLRKVTDSRLRKAEVYNYYECLEESEKLYRELGRPDLLVSMYDSKGKYEKTLEILNEFSLSEHEKLSDKSHVHLGDLYAAHYEWREAVAHYEKVSLPDRLALCYIYTGNYNALINLIDSVDDELLLCDIAHYLESIGLIRDAVRAFIRANKMVQAVKVCEQMSEWKTAIDLARKYEISDVNAILDKYVEHLSARRKFVEIVEVYRKANRIPDAMSIVLKLVSELRAGGQGDAILFKKLFILIGLLYEESKFNNKNDIKNRRARATLNELLEAEEMFSSGANQERSSNKIVDDPWKGAEAYHFQLLTQKHLYNAEFDAALKSAMQLTNYDEFLPPEEVYCLLAISSYHCKNFSLCSKAFIKLESLTSERVPQRNDFALLSLEELIPVPSEPSTKNPNNNPERAPKNSHKVYETMALAIFEHHSPADVRNKERIEQIDCKFCSQSIPDYSTECPNCHTKFMPCIATGRPIMDPVQQWTCSKCNHHAIKDEIKYLNCCPLCHYRIGRH